mmetsp:Transcript_132356/g.295017  ORF Transcript_132356/g.295017 Transcript_132356/m.295017 type:complete len:265 (+) Transcript_132356:44-838(+)
MLEPPPHIQPVAAGNGQLLSEAARASALEDAVRVPSANHDNHALAIVPLSLGDDALIHGLVARSCDRVINLRQHVHLDAKHDPSLHCVAVLLLHDASLLPCALSSRAYELEDFARHRARAEAREDEGRPSAQWEASGVQHHGTQNVDAAPCGEEDAEEDPGKCQPRQQGSTKVARRGEQGRAQAAPKPVQVDVDAHARDTPGGGRNLGCQKFSPHLDGATLDDPVKDADAGAHQGDGLAEAAAQGAPWVAVCQDLELSARFACL